MNSNSLNPETLYRYYTVNRHASVNFAGKSSAAQWVPDAQTDTPSVLTMYRSYQSTRTKEKEDPVDLIMSLIRAEAEASNERLPTAETSDREKRSKNVTKLFKRSGKRSTNSKPDSFERSGLRFIAPAIAATILAFVAIPMLFNAGKQTDAVPYGLVEHYQIAATFISQEKAQSLGFSADSINERNAFSTGLLAMDITVSALGGEGSKLDAANQQLVRLIGAEESRSVDKILNSIRMSMHTAHDSSVSEKMRAEAAESTMKDLTALHSLLKSTSAGPVSQIWFDIGRHIQAISLFAKVQLEFDISEPLNDAMAEFNATEFPENFLSLSKLLDELRLLSSAGSFSNDAAQKVIALCRDIKILMQ